MPICYGMERVIIWLIEVLTLGQFKVTWDIKIFSTQFVTPNLHLLSFKVFGMINAHLPQNLSLATNINIWECGSKFRQRYRINLQQGRT